MDQQSLERIALLEAENERTKMEMNAEVETQGQNQTESVTQPCQRAKRVRKKQRALCWDEFTSVGIEEDGKERARCHHCGIKLVVEKSYGTSTMNRHLTLCPERPQPETRPKYDHKVDREMTSEIIIYHDMPFRYVEYEKVRARDKFLNPDCKPICRQTAALDVFKRFEIEKAKLIDVFAKHNGQVCLTADLWSSRSTVTGYICVTSHYIDESWRLNNKILAFCDLKPPHNGEEIAKKVYDCLKEWGLEKKILTITLDNASANTSMQTILKHRLQSGNGLLCGGNFLHVRCCAHILNLIVQAGLELASGLLENITESVKFVKASESRKDSFATCLECVGIKSGAGLSLDVSTRWNSTYEMLARALKFRKAFAILNLYERGYCSLPTEEECDRGEKICDLLKPFNTITTYFSGVKYPTANIYFIQVWKIELLLMKYANCDDVDVREMAKKMQKKFAKYWNEYSVILAMGAALDPRLKLQILRSAYNKVDPVTAEGKVDIVRNNLILLYEEYKTKSASSSNSSTTLTPHELLNELPLEADVNDVSIIIYLNIFH